MNKVPIYYFTREFSMYADVLVLREYSRTLTVVQDETVRLG